MLKANENEHDKKAQDFLIETDTTFKAVFLRHGKHFIGDDANRDIYRVTLSRGSRSYSFDFGQSVNNSGEYVVFVNGKTERVSRKKAIELVAGVNNLGSRANKNKYFSAPTPFDVLASLTKYEPSDFSDFCSNYGYDVDSRKAKKIYNVVVQEYAHLCRLFNDKELTKMEDIQ